ncbi:acetate/propionate family kinase [Natranaerofaba carboxydovora]|uniref:acetate/propionate family kinase n=1 Tax=Natranaerofaba carboxydovora TaxID=2742683 RepID=UPI001F12E701|nr:acetate kinase [Natranaerofaba carboxydovora]UMZ73318.1 Acetate kinase [Natranaerofaba carboxydovora]
MKVLVINCGSSSLKYQVFNMAEEEVLAKGEVERIGGKNSKLKHKKINLEKGEEGLGEVLVEEEINNHKEAIKVVVDNLVDINYGVINDLSEIYAVGHRVVHGGEEFSDAVIIDDEVLKALDKCKELAPLHNPPNIAGIEAAGEIFKNSVQVGVFDTAFHQAMDEKSYLYGLPYELYQKYGIRKYGFHGTSHKYVSEKASKIMKKPVEELKLISCHLGNGASIAAIDKGKSVDTSMGFTPLEGLVMGTRTGDLDPAIVPFLIEKEKMDTNDINDLLNKKSGVLGLSGISNDFRDLEKAAIEGNYRAKVALDVFVYRVVKFIGSYIMVLGGVDGLIFTAGVGENSPNVRQKIADYLTFAEVKIDGEKNKIKGETKDISAPDSSCRVLVIPTNEELMIARETKRLCD